MSEKKVNPHAGVDFEQLMEMNDSLLAKNTALALDNEDLQKQCELFRQQVIRADEQYQKERDHRREVQSDNEGLKLRVLQLTTRLEAAQGLRSVEKSKRHSSIPKFVIVAAAALVALIVTMELQKLNIIWPTLGFGIQCLMAMVIAWCYAIIWDRSRK